MADAIGRYQELLKERAALDWGDVSRRIWSSIQSGRLQPPAYDVVLVDEAQFFSPLWFEVIRRLVRPDSGHLFAAADPSQGFLRRGGSWKSLGLDVRGKTHRLERSYRTTREILSFAALFYRQRIPQEDAEEETLAPDLVSLPGGAFPEVIPLRAAQEEIARATNEIAVLVERGLPPDHLLALHTDWQGVKALIQALCKRLGAGAAADPKERQPGGYVRVTTLNAGTGLEAPVVFLLGLNRLFEAERSLRISDEEREALILDNTRKLYMATTRAGQRLVITYVGALPEDFLRLLGRLKASAG
jgi:superfamily I DNA/RNA helicase